MKCLQMCLVNEAPCRIKVALSRYPPIPCSRTSLADCCSRTLPSTPWGPCSACGRASHPTDASKDFSAHEPFSPPAQLSAGTPESMSACLVPRRTYIRPCHLPPSVSHVALDRLYNLSDPQPHTYKVGIITPPFLVLQACRVWMDKAICQDIAKTLKTNIFTIAYTVSPYSNVKYNKDWAFGCFNH